MKSYLCALIFIYGHHLWGSFLFMGIFSVYENLFLFMIICGGLFFLWESLLIYDHLWRSFLFMRISSYLWISVRIFSVYENLFLFIIICKNLFFYENFFESLLIYDHLWESLFIDDQLFYYLFFITLTHLRVLILIFFYHSKSVLICIHSSWSVWIENLHEHE